MSCKDAKPISWRNGFLKRLFVHIILIGGSFGLGAAATAIVAAYIILPIAISGVTMGMVGLTCAGATQATDALYNGDSQTRQAVLTQLKAALTSQTPQKVDPQVAAWILPALIQCKTDSDPNVVALAEELIEFVESNTIDTGQQLAEPTAQ